MGNEQSNPKKVMITREKLEIETMKVKSFLELSRNRRGNEVNIKEKALFSMVSGKRNVEDEKQKASSITSDKHFIESINIVLRFLEVLKDRSQFIVDSRGDLDKVSQFVPYFETILLAGKVLNVKELTAYCIIIKQYFGPDIYKDVSFDNKRIDRHLIQMNKDVLPSNDQVNHYLLEFIKKYGLTLEQFNNAGHNVHEDYSDLHKAPHGHGGGGTAQVDPIQQQIIFQQQQQMQMMQQQMQMMQQNQQMMPQQMPQQMMPQQMPQQMMPQQMPQQMMPPQNNFNPYPQTNQQFVPQNPPPYMPPPSESLKPFSVNQPQDVYNNLPKAPEVTDEQRAQMQDQLKAQRLQDPEEKKNEDQLPDMSDFEARLRRLKGE